MAVTRKRFEVNPIPGAEVPLLTPPIVVFKQPILFQCRAEVGVHLMLFLYGGSPEQLNLNAIRIYLMKFCVKHFCD